MDSSPATKCEASNKAEAHSCKTEDSAEKCSEVAGGSSDSDDSEDENENAHRTLPIQTQQGLKLSAVSKGYSRKSCSCS